ncbi:hypothetical protein GCM10023258_20760 [Terrabacter aeriphilus]|uniref:SnoaL-like domain-containing protein n=1 Tax=Terrabacter aeriphilus TaxID=515662 RepID=A0ABP9JCX1_9MICO
MTGIPDVVSRYYSAAASGGIDDVLACFTDDAHVRDEQRDYHGLEEIRSWREGVATRFTYTTEITGADVEGSGTHVVHTHLEGDFPGGVVDLAQRFTVADGLISELLI